MPTDNTKPETGSRKHAIASDAECVLQVRQEELHQAFHGFCLHFANNYSRLHQDDAWHQAETDWAHIVELREAYERARLAVEQEKHGCGCAAAHEGPCPSPLSEEGVAAACMPPDDNAGTFSRSGGKHTAANGNTGGLS